MDQRLGLEGLLKMLMAGAPERVVSASAMASQEDRADLAMARETLAQLAFAVPDVQPSAALRERLLGSRPRPHRPKTPAVIVLDMIGDYLTPGEPLELSRAREIVPALKARLAQARRDKVPIVYVCDEHEPDDRDYEVWPMHALRGTPGSAVWPEIAPEEGDVVIGKPTYSAFTRSRLGAVLDELGTDEIILTGCATEFGLLATAFDALQRGFAVTVPPDCQAGASELGERAALSALSVMPPYAPRY